MKESGENIVAAKSMAFAIRCVKLNRFLRQEKGEYDLSRQLLRCGTSIGANIKEAIRGQSKADFRAKMNISLKEASESEYWIELLHRTGYLRDEEAESLLTDCRELLKLLTSIVRHSAEG
ncbi:four helix bundle protein [Prevotella sp. KH2C16]|uniref:four helix bundle protein n=1 Tax=Prevotella sp. KH2C16 TaxID=1855325 RepID=UPI000B8425FF|nr:four helix bundle protein [Prevotella sp. KH2C16]